MLRKPCGQLLISAKIIGSLVNYVSRATAERELLQEVQKLHDRFTNKRSMDKLTTYVESTQYHSHHKLYKFCCSDIVTVLQQWGCSLLCSMAVVEMRDSWQSWGSWSCQSKRDLPRPYSQRRSCLTHLLPVSTWSLIALVRLFKWICVQWK